MSKRVIGLVVVLVLVTGLVIGCAAKEPAAGGIPENAALQVNGSVATPTGWTEDQIKAMNTLTVQSKNKDGVASDYTGVLISDLLSLAQPKSEATTITFVADDGFTAEAALADVMACANCIVSFRDQGGFSTVLPDMGNKLQVKGVIEIQVK
jgi:DMSO/TMAO reductase YedYZ molybdopterin-dependent catalytic subunit